MEAKDHTWTRTRVLHKWTLFIMGADRLHMGCKNIRSVFYGVIIIGELRLQDLSQ
jgi:hypothetical protein